MPVIALAMTLHDPEGRLAGELRRELPVLARLFGVVSVSVTPFTSAASMEVVHSRGTLLAPDAPDARSDGSKIGRSRRAAVATALQAGAEWVLYCDCDRALHWAGRHPEELRQVRSRIIEHDFTVLGRTPRAFASHPRIQRDTEAIINCVYYRVSGQAWDVGAGARGISRGAAEAILAGCPDDELSNDVSWPLFLIRQGGFSVKAIETEGLEFETADRYADQVAASGGVEGWMEALDGNPRHWLHRLEVARIEIEGMLPFVSGHAETD